MTQFKNVPARRIRQALALLADELCAQSQRVPVLMRGNTISIHIDGITVNIAREGGAA